jgi:hypothetical protein
MCVKVLTHSLEGFKIWSVNQYIACSFTSMNRSLQVCISRRVYKTVEHMVPTLRTVLKM